MTEPNQRWAREQPEIITAFKAQIPIGEFGARRSRPARRVPRQRGLATHPGGRAWFPVT